MQTINIGKLRRLRVKHLELFKAVLETQTLQSAAKATNMTQPAATKLIQDLEEILGVKLFERGKRGTYPTYLGDIVNRHITVLFADLMHMAHEIKLVSEGEEGHIRLGVLPSLAPGLITSVIACMQKQHPKIRLTLHEGTTTGLLESIARNELDITFARVSDSEIAGKLCISHVYEEPFVIVVRHSHPLSMQPSIDWKTLAHATWVLPNSGTPIRSFVDNLFISAGALSPRPAVECITLEKIRHLVQETDMVGILPKSFVASSNLNDSLSILKVDINSYFVPISLVTRYDSQYPPAVLELEKTIHYIVREMGLLVRKP